MLNFLERLTGKRSTNGLLRSCQCTQAQLMSPQFQEWAAQMHERPLHMHRKIWEFCYIAQALYERGKLRPGQRGLGFAVGQEPLPALFARLGCEIVATDLATEDAAQIGWVEWGQHASSLAGLNNRNICDAAEFEQRVSFRFVDMRALPDDLGTYDFIWSSCSLEHLGSLQLGERFVLESLKYLNPGGVAVHTTEYNLQSNSKTVTDGMDVIYRKRDIQRMAANLRRAGRRIDLDFRKGTMPLDRLADKPPYNSDAHLTLLSQGYVITSFGLIIE